VHASSVSSVTRSCWPEIKTIHRAHPDYGSPRVTVELARRGRPVNHKRVESMMAAAGIVARRHRRRRGLTKRDETAAPLPDLVGRLFDPGRMGLFASDCGGTVRVTSV
jgi:transposase InsO family protein